MENVNSIQKFQQLKRDLENENKQIQDISRDIARKEIEHKHAKDVFDRVDKELQSFKSKKEELMHRRINLDNEMKNLQRALDDMKRHGSTSLKL